MVSEADVILLVLAILCIAAGFIYGQHLITISELPGEEEEVQKDEE